MTQINLEELTLRPPRTLNIVFVGHVDSGKSTTCGRILVDLGRIDERTLEKYRRESADLNRASWYLSWCMDINPEERKRGKTIEIGTASFDLSNTRVNILDAPGHKQYVQEMIEAASRAEVGVLIVSARLGEFEASINGGQTREHIMLLKLGGIEHIIVLINKMDNIDWEKTRYDEIVKKISAITRRIFNTVRFVPISGLTGANIKSRHPCDFYDGPSFLEILDNEMVFDGSDNLQSAITHARPENLLVIEKIKMASAVYVYCKANGVFTVGDELKLLPSGRTDTIIELSTEADVECNATVSGETYKMRLNGGIDDLCIGSRLVRPGATQFIPCRAMYAQIFIQAAKSTAGIKAVTVGYTAILHVGNQAVGVKITGLYNLDKKKILVVRDKEKCIAKLELENTIVVECHKDRQDRFSLRDEAYTIASGIIRKVIKE